MYFKMPVNALELILAVRIRHGAAVGYYKCVIGVQRDAFIPM
jgi:hypothetical protein